MTRVFFADSLGRMEPSVASNKPVIVLLDNYAPDRPESLLRFHDLMQKQLAADGYTVESIAPQAHLGSLGMSGKAAHWMGNIDKYVIFPLGLLGQSSHIREKYLGRKIVVHICDQSNAFYATLMRRWFPVVVTCHDLLAAPGHDAGFFATLVRKESLHGLKRAHYVVCDSEAARADLLRLAGKEMAQHSEVVAPAFTSPDAPTPPGDAIERMMRAYEDIYRRVQPPPLPFGAYPFHRRLHDNGKRFDAIRAHGLWRV